MTAPVPLPDGRCGCRAWGTDRGYPNGHHPNCPIRRIPEVAKALNDGLRAAGVLPEGVQLEWTDKSAQ